MFRPRKEAPIPPGIRLFKLELDVFGHESVRPYSEKVLQILLDALTAIDTEWLKSNPGKIPPLYESGVVYTREAYGADERWQDCYTSYLRRRVDCEDASCWRAAEYRVKGIKARAFPTGRRLPGGSAMYHIRVLLPDGRVEDPSRILGMNTPDEGEAMAFSKGRIPKMNVYKAFQEPGDENIQVPERMPFPGDDSSCAPGGWDTSRESREISGYTEQEVLAQQHAQMGAYDVGEDGDTGSGEDF